MRTAPLVIVSMSQGSSSPASPFRPVPASEPQETVVPVSHVIGLSEVSASFEALNIDVEQKPNVVHQAQTSYSPGASQALGSPNMRDNKISTPVSPPRPKRYALQIWLEVEVGPGYFLPPEDDSCSVDYALKVLNCAYPGCKGVYLDRAGHMLAFYGQKGGSKAGLIQDVAIEAGRAVVEMPTWMDLTAKWKVRCVILSEANAILAGCKRLEKEIQRRECLCYQECLTSLHQPSRLSAAATPFKLQVPLPTPGLAGTSSSHLERQGSGPSAGFSLTHDPTTSPVGKLPPPTRGLYPQTSDDDATSDVGLVDPFSRKKGRRS